MSHLTEFSNASPRSFRSTRWHRVSGYLESQSAGSIRRAFTLIEVAIAASVMALVIATSITAMQRAFTALDTARSVTIAGQILQTEIERLRMRDWTEVSGYPSASTSLTVDAGFGIASGMAGRFALSRTVTELEPGRMRKLTYSVAWTGIDGQARSRFFVVCYGQYGLYDFSFYNQI